MTGNEVKIRGRAYNYTVLHTSTGKTVIKFGLQFYSGKDSTGVSKYSFVDCKGFGKDYNLNEKQEVTVIGHLNCEEWTDKQGTKKSKLCIIIDNVECEANKKQTTFVDDKLPWG